MPYGQISYNADEDQFTIDLGNYFSSVINGSVIIAYFSQRKNLCNWMYASLDGHAYQNVFSDYSASMPDPLNLNQTEIVDMIEDLIMAISVSVHLIHVNGNWTNLQNHVSVSFKHRLSSICGRLGIPISAGRIIWRERR